MCNPANTLGFNGGADQSLRGSKSAMKFEQSGGHMPQNGEKNRKLGLNRSLGCGKASVVPDGREFPDCLNHPGLTTIWKPLVDDNIIQFGKQNTSDSRAPRFQVGDQITFVGVGSRRWQKGAVIGVMDGSLDQV